MDIAVHEAAVRLGVHPTRVRQLVRSGDLVGHRIGRMWLVDPQDVGLAALSADLLESAEPRAVSAGVAVLNQLSSRAAGP